MHEFLSGATFILLYGFSYGIILFTISIGLVVTLGLMRVINLAHGAFAAIGGYIAVTLMSRFGLSFPLAVLIAVCAVVVLGVVVERLCYVHLYKSSELDQILMTTGLIFVTIAGLNFCFGPNLLPTTLPRALAANVDLGIRTFQAYRLLIIGVGIVLILALWLVLERTSFGARLRAAVDNRSMAEATGIDVGRLFAITFGLGCGLASLGGALGFAILPLEPLYPLKYLTIVLIVVTLSDFDNIKSAMVAAIFVGIVDTAGRYLLPDFGAFIIYVVLIGLMIARHRPSFSATTANVFTVVKTDLLRRHRLHPAEAVFWGATVLVFFVFPDDLAFATSVLIMALFVLSLDLILGFAGIVTLGHAVFFGIGAYVAALLALAGYREPISGALIAGGGAAAFAIALGPVVLRLTGLPLIMVTLGVDVILYEAANKAVSITGGDNGLPGIELDPVLGLFHWSVYEDTSYLYALAWLFLLFLLVRKVIASPFGVALQGIRENRGRMRLIGAPVLWHLVRAYAISAFIAGIAGALSAQTTQFVGLEVLSLNSSVDVLVMLVLGGIGRLYGGLIGAPVYMLVSHLASEWDPYNWLFAIGAMLIVIVRFARGGILGIVDAAVRRILPLHRETAR